MICAVDYDGTIADTNQQKASWIKENLGITVPPWDCDRSNCVPIVGLDAYERMAAEVYEREATLSACEVPGAIGALNTLQESGMIYIVTARDDRTLVFAREWLRLNHLDRVVTDVRSSCGLSKVHICQQVRASVLIDDDVRHLQAPGLSGVRVILLQNDRPGTPVLDHGVPVCRNWAEAVAAVQQLQ